MFRKYQLLIVDDEEITLEMLAEFLGEYFDVTACTNGFDALVETQEKTFDGIVLDINMPKMNGLELCEKIKENPQYEYVPIVFLTGSSDVRVIEEGFSVGAIDYILKPVVLEELYIRTKNHIQLAKQSEKLYVKQLQINKQLEESIEKLAQCKQKTTIDIEDFDKTVATIQDYLKEQKNLLATTKKLSKL